MKMKLCIVMILLFSLTLLSGCGLTEGVFSLFAPDSGFNSNLPHLMVQSIHVSMNPHDPDFERHYQTQENLTATLNLLRDMSTDEIPEAEPQLSDGQTYYKITAFYACGEQQEYYILGHQFFKAGQEPWCQISTESAMGFAQFIREHQSDDGSYVPPPTTEPPTETTEPTGTAPQET